MKPAEKVVRDLMKKTGMNITQLADEITAWRGKKVHRQQLQRWTSGASMALETAIMLEGFSKSLDNKNKKGDVK